MDFQSVLPATRQMFAYFFMGTLFQVAMKNWWSEKKWKHVESFIAGKTWSKIDDSQGSDQTFQSI